MYAAVQPLLHSLLRNVDSDCDGPRGYGNRDAPRGMVRRFKMVQVKVLSWEKVLLDDVDVRGKWRRGVVKE